MLRDEDTMPYQMGYVDMTDHLIRGSDDQPLKTPFRAGTVYEKLWWKGVFAATRMYLTVLNAI